MLALLLTAALAEDVEDGEDLDVPAAQKTPAPDGWGFGTSGQTLDIDDDDAGMADFAAEQRKKPPAPDLWHVDPTGRPPLTDAFDVQISALDARYVVAELPVLVADGRDAFRAAHPGGLVVVGEVSSGGLRQVVTQQITADGVLESGPTLVFLKAALPNPAPTGEVRFVVRLAELPAAAQKELYTKVAPYVRR